MMKHILLLLFVATVGLSFGQVTYPSQMNANVQMDDPKPSADFHPQQLQERVVTPELVPVGTASNMWTILNPDQSQVDYDPDLGLLTFVHRQDIGTFIEGGSGTVRYDMSTDMGLNWDVDQGPLTPQMVSTNAAIPITTIAGDDEVRGCRYPNGIIYNPPGNEEVSNAYYVSTGPCLFTVLGDATGWGVIYKSSQKLDGSAAVDDYSIYMEDEVEGGADGSTKSMCQGGDAVHAIGYNNGSGSIQVAWKGVPNGDGTAFDWTPTEIEPEFKLDGGGFILYGGNQNMAFSNDGSVGYLAFTGALEAQDEEWFIPNVYSTTDNGETWSLASGDLDIANTEVGTLLGGFAYTRDIDCVVDAAGRLHVFSEVMQSTEDNSGFFYEGYMVDFIWDGTEWSEIIIGQIDDTQASGFADGSFQDQHTHPQASMSADGTVASFIWTSSLDSDINDQPDVFGRALNTTNGEMTPIKNLTEDTDAETFSFYPTAASTLITDGDDMDYEIPIVMFIDWTGSNLDPVQFYYLKGAGFDLEEFVVGVDEEESPLLGLMLYPNPAANNARLTFGVEDVLDAQIRVIDALGRVQMVIPNRSLATGQHNYDLDVSDLASGIYSVEIIADQTSTVLSLNVQH